MNLESRYQPCHCGCQDSHQEVIPRKTPILRRSLYNPQIPKTRLTWTTYREFRLQPSDVLVHQRKLTWREPLRILLHPQGLLQLKQFSEPQKGWGRARHDRLECLNPRDEMTLRTIRIVQTAVCLAIPRPTAGEG
ncbi:hypothetical protein JG688_00004882 [Phytophthora aleatoria]|uniref:Uncharacterized protein n=1 Tax=Phytophthora aleatoria TaxID=2496075 RepID=A0A8J5J8U3_9STRA|nr:hypothetical protein JG688_00004882 [Phytophthora aleatoria]